MNKSEAERYLLQLNKYSKDLSDALTICIMFRAKNGIINFNNDPTIFDGFNEVFLLIKKFNQESGVKLNFIEEIRETGQELNKAVDRINELDLQLSFALQLLQENNIPNE